MDRKLPQKTSQILSGKSLDELKSELQKAYNMIH